MILLFIVEDHEHLSEVTCVGDNVCLSQVIVGIGYFDRSHKGLEVMGEGRVVTLDGFVVIIELEVKSLGYRVEARRNTWMRELAKTLLSY